MQKIKGLLMLVAFIALLISVVFLWAVISSVHSELFLGMKEGLSELVTPQKYSRGQAFFRFIGAFGFFLIVVFIELGVLRIFLPRIFKPIFNFYKMIVTYPFLIVWKGIMSNHKKSSAEVEQKLKAKNVLTLETTKSEKIEITNPFRGILVIGGAGSGKSESFAIPFIREFSKQNFTGIIYDFKFPTLGQEVENYYTENQSPVKRYYLNFGNAELSHRVNPLNPLYMPFSAYAREYASAIIKNLMKESIRKEDFWSRSATDLLTAVIWYLRKKHPQYCDLPHVLALLQNPYKELIERLCEDKEVRSMIISIATAVESGASEQIAGVVGSLQGAVAQINTPEFMWIFGADEFDLRLNSVENPSIMIVGSHPTISGTIAPLCSLVTSVGSKMMNQPDRLPSTVMLDESPTIFIPNIEVIPNTGRSNKISTILFVQDLSQLIDGYGKEKADVLFSACGSHFYGRVASSHTADILSKQFGKEDRLFETKSTNKKNTSILQNNKGKSYSYQERDVFKSSEFMNLGVGEFVGRIVENENPLIYAQYKMSKTNTKVDLASVVPGTSPKKIQEYYERVSKEAEQILKGELEYPKAVNREELIKPTLQEQQEIKEALDEDFNFIKEVGKINPEI